MKAEENDQTITVWNVEHTGLIFKGCKEGQTPVTFRIQKLTDVIKDIPSIFYFPR